MLKIYIENLGKYNEGELVDDCIELPVSEEEFQDLFERIGVNDRYEKFVIQAYETDIKGLKIGERDCIAHLNEIAERLEDISDIEAFVAILEYEVDTERALDVYEEGNFNYYPNIYTQKELGEYAIEEFWDIPEEIVPYIDYEKVGRDWEFSVAGGFYGNGFLEVF